MQKSSFFVGIPLNVIPAQGGLHKANGKWIPAFAGMTSLPKASSTARTILFWKSLRTAFSFTLPVAFVLLLTSSPSLKAQNNPELIVTLMNRVGELEAEQRNLHGQLDEVRHELSILQKKMETLSADVELRFANTEANALPMLVPEPVEREVSSASPQAAEKKYEQARALLEKGDYEAAEGAFEAFLSAYSTHERAGAAQYWLGVTFFIRNQYDNAAASFAKLFKTYPKSSKVPDGLLKLAKSLTALNRKADACTTLDQLSKDFPKVHQKEVSAERQKLKCN